MIKLDKRIVFLISISIIICASFQPVIAGSSFEKIQHEKTEVDYNTAINVAFSKLKSIKKTNFEIANSNVILDDKGRSLCYVFNLDPEGYIVVTGYKTLPPIIAYSFTSSFSEKGNLLYDLVREDIILRLTYSQKISEQLKEDNQKLWNSYLDLDNPNLDNYIQWPKEGTTSSGGWLETEWHQNSPFNDMVPMDLNTNERSVAGCPSVTMAQILNYHQTTNNVQFDDNDDYYHNWGNYFWIDDDYEAYDFPSFPQLNSYLDTLVQHYNDGVTLTDEDKASLTFACGVACKQVYSTVVSGTFGVGQAYDAYKRFYFDDCVLLTDEDSNVYERVQENIMDGLPVHLAVVTEAWDSGHNLVIDGYKEDGFYHLNFGWGGPYDGWYKIPEEIPYDLTVLEGLIVDIIDENTYSSLHGNGVLYWPEVNSGATLEASFTIENVGEPGSCIDWVVFSWPEWGEWSFDPSSGTDLTPESGPLTIDVSLVVPSQKNKHFNGYVKVVDTENNINSCLIHVSLTTPRNSGFFSIMELISEKYPNSFPLFRFFFSI